MSAWREVSSGREEPRQPNHRFWDAPLRQSFKIRHRTRQIRSSDGIPTISEVKPIELVFQQPSRSHLRKQNFPDEFGFMSTGAA